MSELFSIRALPDADKARLLALWPLLALSLTHDSFTSIILAVIMWFIYSMLYDIYLGPGIPIKWGINSFSPLLINRQKMTIHEEAVIWTMIVAILSGIISVETYGMFVGAIIGTARLKILALLYGRLTLKHATLYGMIMPLFMIIPGWTCLLLGEGVTYLAIAIDEGGYLA